MSNILPSKINDDLQIMMCSDENQIEGLLAFMSSVVLNSKSSSITFNLLVTNEDFFKSKVNALIEHYVNYYGRNVKLNMVDFKKKFRKIYIFREKYKNYWLQ